MTETCGIIAFENPYAGRQNCGAAGMLVPGVECQIVSVDEMKPHSARKQGETCVQGANMMKGYYNNIQASNLMIGKQGWLHTRDLGFFDDDGLVYVVGRIKELIKYKSFQVSYWSDGFANTEAGEVPIGYVVCSPNISLTEEDVKKFIADQVGLSFLNIQGFEL